MSEITALYRDWKIEVFTDAAIATNPDGERFECYRQPSAEDALRRVRNKIDRNEGPENWIEGYEDEALR